MLIITLRLAEIHSEIIFGFFFWSFIIGGITGRNKA
jgi:hypothetical protein